MTTGETGRRVVYNNWLRLVVFLYVTFLYGYRIIFMATGNFENDSIVQFTYIETKFVWLFLLF